MQDTPSAADSADKPQTEAPVVAYKGFDKDWKCRGFQYEVGKTYTHQGIVKACEAGFHACEYPLDVFGYYGPAESRFALVELSGSMSRESGGDTKVAAANITIKAELSLPQIIQSAVDWAFARSKPEGPSATGYLGAASATGYQGAASATGDLGAASATGRFGRAMGKQGNALFLVERDQEWNIVAAWAGIVGRDGIKPLTWYELRSGKPVEVA